MQNQIEIEIRSLGPIRDARIELASLTIFSGESSLGKSYAAFACHYVYHTLSSSRLIKYFKEKQIDFKSIWDSTPSGEVVYSADVDDVISWMEKDCIRYIGYLIGNPDFQGEVKFHFNIEETSFPFLKEESLQGMEGNEELFYRLSYKNRGFNMMSRNFLINEYAFAAVLRSALCTHLFDDHFFLIDNFILPPARASLMDMVSRPVFRAGMYDEFFNFKENLMGSRYDGFKVQEFVEKMANKIIAGNLKYNDGNIFYQGDNDVNIPLSAAASSIKELAAYLLWLTKTPVVSQSILFEEPEAHLHPRRQQYVADTFGYLINMECPVTITTHSDYLLKRINRLGRLKNLYYSSLQPKVKEILDKLNISFHSLIDFGRTRAYLMVANGDGTSSVKRIDSENGISFGSFEDVIEEGFDLDEEIASLVEISPGNTPGLTRCRASGPKRDT